ncbi:hypothetical protein [Streptomyces sp. NPDC048157]|uniref:hypothetical protein n=1 Tax=Streptomyces sp. NPDC048157 TaxID=3365503 RepID=UPI00371DD305
MSQAEASRIVLDLLRRGFSQTDIARGLGLGAKGSGSYVGQIAKGVKGSGKVAELRALSRAVSGKDVPGGRSRAATEARQEILGGAVKRVPRQRKSGGAAAVRKAATKVSRRGYVQAFAGKQSLEGPSGGRPIEDAIRALAVVDGRIALRVVGRFDAESAAHRSQYWRKFYGKRRRTPARKKGSGRVLEASFGGGRQGLSARTWATYIDAAGTFQGALAQWMTAQGYDVPDALLRTELTGWTG